MIVSPAEPARLKEALKAKVGTVTVSSMTEKYGADFLLPSHSFGVVGVQRKEVNDLIASVRDDRLLREMGQMKALGLGVLLIEGRIQWTNDGLALTRSSWTMSQHLGMLWSVRSRGFWIDSTDDLASTINWLSTFQRWLAKPRHSSLLTRSTASVRSEFGTKDNLDWASFFLQGFEGIGPGVAAAIIDKFGGVPLSWNVTVEELMSVKGIGKVRAEKLYGSLNGR